MKKWGERPALRYQPESQLPWSMSTSALLILAALLLILGAAIGR
jgi:hypothetical protein